MIYSVAPVTAALVFGSDQITRLLASAPRIRSMHPCVLGPDTQDLLCRSRTTLVYPWWRMISEISGATKIFGIIADPIQHVQTPQVFNDFLRTRGVDGVLVPLHISKDDFAGCIDGLRRMRNLGGLIVTVPHKVRMIGMCDEVTERARRIEAVNVVRREHDCRLVADMLDGEGFISGLR